MQLARMTMQLPTSANATFQDANTASQDENEASIDANETSQDANEVSKNYSSFINRHSGKKQIQLANSVE